MIVQCHKGAVNQIITPINLTILFGHSWFEIVLETVDFAIFELLVRTSSEQNQSFVPIENNEKTRIICTNSSLKLHKTTHKILFFKNMTVYVCIILKV